ncbi:MAG: hypothetical protein KKF67_02235 [Nanoarchaeota archaeon]|nr:hypothetical protein [Nanoarchaeota archaeon]
MGNIIHGEKAIRMAYKMGLCDELSVSLESYFSEEDRIYEEELKDKLEKEIYQTMNTHFKNSREHAIKSFDPIIMDRQTREIGFKA